MKKIDVSKDLCIGCGACVAIDPEHFEFDDEGKSSVIHNENIEIQGQDNENLTNAIESCPTSAISIKEVEESGKSPATIDEEENTCTCEEDCKEHCHHSCTHDCISEEESEEAN